MLDRCRLPTHQAYYNYGGRGIKVCKRWQRGFELFWEDMGPAYKKGLTLERSDNSKGYSPSNCTWATYRAQGQNRRNNKLIATPKGLRTAPEVARMTGISRSTIYYRAEAGVLGWDELTKKPDVRNRFTTS